MLTLHRTRFILALTLAALVAAPSALADESLPDCEDGQENPLAGTGATLCEGEHWDGQDPSGADAVGISVGAAGSPTPQDPVHVHAYTNGRSVFVNGAAFGAGESSAFVDADSGTVSWWGRDGTNVLLGGTPIEGLFETLDAALGRSNPGGDGNAIAWVVGFSSHAVASASGEPAPWGEPTGEGDCTQAEYESSPCARDDTAVTLVLLP